MKINYDMNENYFNCYNEAQGIFANKNILIKNPKKKIQGYIQTGLTLLIYSMIILLFWIFDVVRTGHDTVSNIIFVLHIMICTFFIIYFANFCIVYRIEKKKKHSGTLEITEKGITDFADEGTVVTVKLEDIEFIAIKKYTITLVLNTHFIFFININQKDKLLEEIKKYRKDIRVIEQ